MTAPQRPVTNPYWGLAIYFVLLPACALAVGAFFWLKNHAALTPNPLTNRIVPFTICPKWGGNCRTAYVAPHALQIFWLAAAPFLAIVLGCFCYLASVVGRVIIRKISR
jgi:hypothetical protein